MTNTEMDNSFEKETEETKYDAAKQANETNSVCDDKETSVVYSSEWLKQNTKIHGWLSFFLIVVLIFGGCILSPIYDIATFKAEDYAGNGCLIACDIFFMVFMFGLAVYTVYLFVNRKPNAVFFGIIYVIFVILSNLLGLIDPDETGIFSETQLILRSIVGVIWLLYLIFSEQVQEIIPKSFRKITKFDWGIVAGIILIPIVFFIIGTIQINSLVDNYIAQEETIKNMPIAYNERTDGRVIFKIPEGFTCKSSDVDVEGEQYTVFYINNDEIGECTMCSDYDTDTSESNFSDYWENWKDDDAKNYPMYDVSRGAKDINGNTCRYRITKYDIAGIYVYWRFYLLFNQGTGKVFVASFYDRDESIDYVNELLYSVRFPEVK